MSASAEWPRLPDGDVVFAAPSGYSWKLHSAIISQFSTGFRQDIQATRAHVSKKRKTETTAIKWKFMMTVIGENEKFVQFTPVDLSAKQPLVLPHGVNGMGGRPEYLTTYDNLFRCFYNLEPDLTGDGSDETILYRAENLINAADNIGSLACVRKTVEARLLQMGPGLWKQVSLHAIIFADMAIRLESPPMFKESMIHIIGQSRSEKGLYNDGFVSSLNLKYFPDIKKLAEKKLAELAVSQKAVELQLATFFPQSMTRQTVGGKAPTRVDYLNDFYSWQSLILIRQHITVAMANDQTRRNGDMGYTFYRQLCEGGKSYCRGGAVDQFRAQFPMTQKAMQKFEKALKDMKDAFKPLCARFLVDNAHPLPPDHNHPRGYMTCFVIGDEDLPWIDKGQPIARDLLFPTIQRRAPAAVMSARSSRAPQPALASQPASRITDRHASLPTSSRAAAAIPRPFSLRDSRETNFPPAREEEELDYEDYGDDDDYDDEYDELPHKKPMNNGSTSTNTSRFR